jgi:hypothetical protein
VTIDLDLFLYILTLGKPNRRGQLAKRQPVTHGKSCPDACSQCANVPVRKVTVIDHALHVDGVPVGRDYQPERVVTARRRGVKRR